MVSACRMAATGVPDPHRGDAAVDAGAVEGVQSVVGNDEGPRNARPGGDQAGVHAHRDNGAMRTHEIGGAGRCHRGRLERHVGAGCTGQFGDERGCELGVVLARREGCALHRRPEVDHIVGGDLEDRVQERPRDCGARAVCGPVAGGGR